MQTNVKHYLEKLKYNTIAYKRKENVIYNILKKQKDETELKMKRVLASANLDFSNEDTDWRRKAFTAAAE